LPPFPRWEPSLPCSGSFLFPLLSPASPYFPSFFLSSEIRGVMLFRGVSPLRIWHPFLCLKGDCRPEKCLGGRSRNLTVISSHSIERPSCHCTVDLADVDRWGAFPLLDGHLAPPVDSAGPFLDSFPFLGVVSGEAVPDYFDVSRRLGEKKILSLVPLRRSPSLTQGRILPSGGLPPPSCQGRCTRYVTRFHKTV